MEQAEKKTFEQYALEKHGFHFEHTGREQTIIKMANEFATSQFKSPPVISEKEILEILDEHLEIEYCGGQASHVSGKSKCVKDLLSLSSERAMAFDLWKLENEIIPETDAEGKLTKMYLCRGTLFYGLKSTSDLFDIFAKEKGYK